MLSESDETRLLGPGICPLPMDGASSLGVVPRGRFGSVGLVASAGPCWQDRALPGTR